MSYHHLRSPYLSTPSGLRNSIMTSQVEQVDSTALEAQREREREREQEWQGSLNKSYRSNNFPAMHISGRASGRKMSPPQSFAKPSPSQRAPSGRVSRTPYVINEDDDAEGGEDDDVALVKYQFTQSHRPVDRRKASARDRSKSPADATMTDTLPTTPGRISKARALKMTLKPSPDISDSNIQKRGAEKDPENHMIKRLRDESCSWDDIAKTLNKERVTQGGDPSWTAAAVYARFVRNAPRITQMQGETFDPRDYMSIKRGRKKHTETTPLPQLSESGQVMLIEAYEEVQASFWERVADTMRIKTGRQLSAEQCLTLFQAI